MYASPAAVHTVEHDEAGFAAPRHRLIMLALRERIDEMLVFYVIALALLAAIIIPVWQATTVAPIVERVVVVESAAKKADRLRSPSIDLACAGATYGNETSECLVAIAGQSGRDRSDSVRKINFGTAGNG